MIGLTRRYYYPVASASGTGSGVSPDITVNKPTGTVDGDIMIAAMAVGSAFTWTGDTGWTEIIDQGSTPSLRIAYKVASSEGASYTFTANANVTGIAAIVTFRGLQYDTAGGAVTTRVGNGSLAIAQITSAGGVLLAIAASGGPTGTPTHSVPTGMDTAFSVANANFDRLSIFFQTVDSGATGTRTTTIAGNAGEDSSGLLVGLTP